MAMTSDLRRAVALAAAGTCAAGLVGIGVLALSIRAGHARDVAMLDGFTGLYGYRIDSEIRVLAQLADPVPYALVGLTCVGVALVRRRRWRAAAVGTLLVATGATTHALKHLLAQPRYADLFVPGRLQDASWPSGHTTAAMTLAMCAVIVAPPAWRAAAALVGGALTLGLSYATLALTWHYPSEVLGGFLVAGLWVFLALAALGRLERDDPEPAHRPSLAWLLGAGGAGAVGATAVVAAASQRVTVDGGDRVTTIAGALAIALLALALLVAVVIAAAAPAPGRPAQRRRSASGARPAEPAARAAR